ncbi:EAL domain-containing protein (putative c-di-GMP-specific phosphodiesterase class I) [Paraburkholderia sp. BL6669N2]|uniref:EAL domain-containing protein n=1 Tax=Paraburkholderia sp. BL6669N2 TaxID=1938807 RepID=UPI000E3B03DC|nr:EAL domain-containing protein [Paraburkholderia sp. BL6669N2]REG49015.1 EAL domain-containing protein (putative c-di-GMP-specific phosphodiesterase class I) [Paraburkholderia sp. BL6669N2]
MKLPDILHFHESNAQFVSLSACLGDLTLSSAFQPIFSISHRRAIGYEALLRARDPLGNEVQPLSILDGPIEPGRWSNLERGVQWLHASNFVQMANAGDQLFLNVRPDGFIVSEAYRQLVENSMRRLQLAPDQVVLEVLEMPNGDLQQLVDGVASFRQLGFLIALDDFGAGHSNIDRVWQLQPDIVKLDRRVIERAAQNPRWARQLPRLVSLLHETGALVLVEGVETQHEALLAIEADSDFVQGFYFARPAQSGADEASNRATMDSLWQMFRARVEENVRRESVLLATYTAAMQKAAERFEAGVDLAQTCEEFLQLEGAERCFLLNAQGEQNGADLTATRGCVSPSDLLRAGVDASGACWERRPYFRNAIAQPGKIQVTRPYLSINAIHLCVTFSIAVLVMEALWVLCADINWQHVVDRCRTDNAARWDS